MVRTVSFGQGNIMVDRFTKCVLTVIALSLVIIAFENAAWSAKAQSTGVQRVAVCDIAGNFCAAVEALDRDPNRQGLATINSH